MGQERFHMDVDYYFKQNPINEGKVEMKLKGFIPPSQFKELRDKIEELGGEYENRIGFVFDEKPDLTPILGEPIEDPSIEQGKKRQEREEKEKIKWENKFLWRTRTIEDTLNELSYIVHERPEDKDGEVVRFTFNVPVIGNIGKFKTGELKKNNPNTSLTLRSYVRKWGYEIHSPALFEVDNGYAKTETILNNEGAIDIFLRNDESRYKYYFWVKERVMFDNKNELKKALRSIKKHIIVPIGAAYDKQIIKAIASNPEQPKIYQKYLDEFFVDQ